VDLRAPDFFNQEKGEQPTPAAAQQREPMPPTAPDRWPAEFAAWWKIYPRQVKRQAAEAAYFEARRNGASAAELAAGAERYAEYVVAPKTPPAMNPANWLRHQRWHDKPFVPSRYAGRRRLAETARPPVELAAGAGEHHPNWVSFAALAHGLPPLDPGHLGIAAAGAR
jgi:hypothetical protein